MTQGDYCVVIVSMGPTETVSQMSVVKILDVAPDPDGDMLRLL